MTERLEIEQANRICFESVEGWVGDRIWMICEFLKRDHALNSVKGSIAEIGVHHGKLFFLISHIADESDRLIALDLFDDQARNIDGSGRGSRVAFEEHLTTRFPYLGPFVSIIQADSMSITDSICQKLFLDPVRVFSVDGGHTVAHVVTTYSDHGDVLLSLRAYLDQKLGDELHTEQWRYAELCGFKVLCFG
jgi:hypothetical protein